MSENRMGEFWAIPKWIMGVEGLSLEARVLFGVLFTRRNGENVSWPSQAYLAGVLHVGSRSIRRYIDELKEQGLLETEQQGLRRTNRYYLRLTGQVGQSASLKASRPDSPVHSRPDSPVHSLSKRTDVREEVLLVETNKTARPLRYDDGSKIILLPDESMSLIDDRDRSFPRKRIYGNEKVDWTLDYIEHLLGRALGGQERWNRIYAKHLTNKYGMTKTKQLLEFVCSPSSWWFTKLSQVSTLYKNAERIFAEMGTPQTRGKTIEELTVRAKK